VIPRAISDRLEQQDLSVLYEIRDLVNELISSKEVTESQPDMPSNHGKRGEILEERHSGSITYRLERVSCGKSCKGCPHGPYWYGYWREGGKTHSKYIGKTLKPLVHIYDQKS
jgi:hypothetical protein